VPLISAAMPVPEPPPVTEIRTSGRSLIPLRPRQREVDDGIGTFVFDVGGGGVGTGFAESGSAGGDEQ
jgi:hypothetical protein